MAEKKVAHALFEFVNADGVRQVAVRGQTIEVDGDELARGEEHGAFFADDDAPDVSSPLDGALAGDDEDLDGEIGEVDLVAAVAEMDAETRAALSAALAAVEAGAVSSPAGAQPTPLDEDALAVEDELSSTGTVSEAEQQERPARTANKAVWLEFRGLSDLTEEQAEDVTVKQLQDDAFMASYQRPTA